MVLSPIHDWVLIDDVWRRNALRFSALRLPNEEARLSRYSTWLLSGISSRQFLGADRLQGPQIVLDQLPQDRGRDALVIVA